MSQARESIPDLADITKSDMPVSSIETVDFFGGQANRRGTLQSTGSSSSTSLEVSEILEGARRPGQEMMYEETTEEEEELGKDGEEEIGAPQHQQLEERVEEDQATPAQYDPRIWPKPPDVDPDDVGLEAQRLASQAIHRAAQQQRSLLTLHYQHHNIVIAALPPHGVWNRIQ